MSTRNNRVDVSLHTGLVFGLFTALVITFALYVHAEKHLERAKNLRHQSLLLADELRQSSDNLTRMARSFIATSNPIYQTYYHTIIAIRDGKLPRPQGYRNSYWELVLVDREPPSSPTDPQIALLDLMRQNQFSDTELELLASAKSNSDALTNTEIRAMKLVEMAGDDLEQQRSRALAIVFGDSYNRTKASTLEPINQVYALMDERTRTAVTKTERNALMVRLTLIGFGFSHIFGYSAEEVLGNNITMIMPASYRHKHNDFLKRHDKGQNVDMLIVLREEEGQRKDGEIFPMSLSVTKVLRADKITFVGVIRDISQQRRDEEKIYRLAFFDPLTNLPNRRLLYDRLQQAIHTSCRTNQHGALMFLDLDHFKQLNDSLGHDLGDILLQQVALRLQDCVRESDSVARMGGDEFVMLIEALSVYPNEAASQAEAIAHKVLASLAQPYRLREYTYNITPSTNFKWIAKAHQRA